MISPQEIYLKRLIADGEGQTLDFKFNISSASKIARTLVAFANSVGGRLLIGVKDNGRIIGINSDEEAYMIDLAATRHCLPEVRFKLTTHTVEDKTVLEVEVPASETEVHQAKTEDGDWVVYIRHDDKNIHANKIMSEVLRRKRSPTGATVRYEAAEKALLDYLTTNAQISFSQLCRLANIRPHIAERVLINLASVDLISIDIGHNSVSYSLMPQPAGGL